MRTKPVLLVLGAAILAVSACEEITNPIEEMGEFAPPWVAFEAPRTVTGPHGSWVPVRYGGIAVRPEEDVNVVLEFGGSAVFGEDFFVVADSGSLEVASGFDASGGTALFDYDPFQEAAFDTLWLWIPTTATVGSALEISMVEASTSSGSMIGTGYLGSWTDFTLTVVRAPAEIQLAPTPGLSLVTSWMERSRM